MTALAAVDSEHADAMLMIKAAEETGLPFDASWALDAALCLHRLDVGGPYTLCWHATVAGYGGRQLVSQATHVARMEQAAGQGCRPQPRRCPR